MTPKTYGPKAREVRWTTFENTGWFDITILDYINEAILKVDLPKEERFGNPSHSNWINNNNADYIRLKAITNKDIRITLSDKEQIFLDKGDEFMLHTTEKFLNELRGHKDFPELTEGRHEGIRCEFERIGNKSKGNSKHNIKNRQRVEAQEYVQER